MKKLLIKIGTMWRARSAGEKNGLLIVFEGFDGSGKTTQISLLNEKLIALGYKTLVTKQPTSNYRKDPLVKHFLKKGGTSKEIELLMEKSAIDRLSHVNSTISNALSKGFIVICDRYVYSSIALFAYRGINPDLIIKSNTGIIEPNFCFYLDLDSTTLSKRIKQRDGNLIKLEEKKLESIDRICFQYKAMSDLFVCVNASLKKNHIHKLIIGHLVENYKLDNTYNFLTKKDEHRVYT